MMGSVSFWISWTASNAMNTFWINQEKKIRRNFRRISASLWLTPACGKMIVEKDAKEE